MDKMDKRAVLWDVYRFASVIFPFLGERLLKIAGASEGILTAWWILMFANITIPVACFCYKRGRTSTRPQKYLYYATPVVLFLALCFLEMILSH